MFFNRNLCIYAQVFVREKSCFSCCVKRFCVNSVHVFLSLISRLSIIVHPIHATHLHIKHCCETAEVVSHYILSYKLNLCEIYTEFHTTKYNLLVKMSNPKKVGIAFVF
jgi:hypothetical protein